MTSNLESWRRAAYNAEECLTGCLASPEIAKHLDQATARTILEKLHQARIEMLAASEEATQPAAGEPEQQTAINADDLPTKKYPLAAFDFADPVAAGEPVAWECIHGIHVFLSYEKEGDPERAVPLFRAAPPAAAHGDEYEIWSAAQLAPGEGIEDGAERIRVLIGNGAHGDEAVRKDAERYRWLSQRDRFASVHTEFNNGGVYREHRVMWHVPGSWVEAKGEGLDAAIDAAMRAQAGEGGEM